MNPKLVVFDLDGTLLNDDHEILQSSIDAINESHEKGILIAIATSRSLYTLDKEIKTIRPDILIASDGAQIMVNGENIYLGEIPASEVRQLINSFYDFSCCNIELAIDSTDAFYWNCKTKDELDARWINAVDFIPMNYNGTALKMCVYCENPSLSRRIEDLFPQYEYVMYSNQAWLQITNPQISKANALRHVANHLGLSLETVVSFGDDYADCDMLAISGIGVAMGNSNDTVKNHSNVVIGTNNEDSICSFLKELYNYRR